MPELPEVETTRKGILPHLLNHRIQGVTVRNRQLRWPVPRQLEKQFQGQTITAVERRAKYLLIRTANGTLILHLGMSGSLRILPEGTSPQVHDHLDIVLDNGMLLRLRDPRRFGAALWTRADPLSHPRLQGLGPEPLGNDFNVDYLAEKCRGRKQSIKQLIMDSHIVVGVGNIYASEALFLAGIHPACAAGKISHARLAKLVEAVRDVLAQAIREGGTTLRDFQQSDGTPGYFKQSLNVYGRAGEACNRCGRMIKQVKQGQRSTYYCPGCQH